MKWLLAFRIKTLTATIVPVFVGTALVIAEGKTLIPSYFIYALLSALFIQIAVNLFNDAIDFKKGADTETRIGPKRVTQSGAIPHKFVMWGGVISCLLAILLAIPLVVRGGEPIIIIGLASLFCAYIYTGGPYPLAYKGLGDLFVVLFFGVIAVMGVYYLQTLTWSLEAFIAGLQVGFLATVLIVINNIRDMEQDKIVRKQTLAVRFGEVFSKNEIVFLVMSSFLMVFFWIYKYQSFKLALPLLSFPLAVKLILDLFKNKPGEAFNIFLSRAAAIHLLFGVLMTLGFII